MLKNRSVPVDTILPHLAYEDVGGALTWLAKAFSFTEQFRYGEPGGPVQGAQMHLGGAWIMLATSRLGRASPSRLGQRTQSLTVFVEDVDAHYQKAKSAGARIVEEIHETEYGERQYGPEDHEGHHWLFAKHVRT